MYAATMTTAFTAMAGLTTAAAAALTACPNDDNITVFCGRHFIVMINICITRIFDQLVCQEGSHRERESDLTSS